MRAIGESDFVVKEGKPYDWGCSSVVGYMLGMCEATSTPKNKKGKPDYRC